MFGVPFALWLVAAALAAPEDALDPAMRHVYLDARAAETRGDYAAAAGKYRFLLRAEPSFTAARVDLGRTLAAMGDLEAAIAAYRAAPYDAEATEALGRLYLEQGAWAEAAEQFRKLEDLALEDPEATRLLTLALAPTDPDAARTTLHRYLGRGVDLAAPGPQEAVLAVVDGLAVAGRSDEARRLLIDLVPPRPPEDGAAVADPAALRARLDLLDIEDDARRLASAGAEPLVGEAALALDRARQAFADGDVEGARARLTALIERAPRSPAVWAALSDVEEARGDVAAAEQAIIAAIRLAPLEWRYPARLGDLLAGAYAGRYDAEAAAAYREALRLAPDQADLWRRLAGVERGARRPDRLVASADAWARYLALDPDGPHADDARRVLAGMTRQRPPAPDIPPGPGRPASIPEAAWDAYWLAEAYDAKGRTDEALAALGRSLEAYGGYAAALNLRARIEARRGDVAAARHWYGRSLAADASQTDVHEALADLAEKEGDVSAAERHWGDAARLGSADAHFALARSAWLGWRLWEARARLDAYFAAATSGRHHEDARALRDRVDRDIRLAWASGGLALTMAFVGPIGWAARRRGAAAIDALLAASPAAYRDVARIGSAIRHEVLKHNTTLLTPVADALERGDPEPARWAADKLYGERGAIARFRGYVRELELLGRVHGVRLDLRRADPTFGPLVAAIDRLARHEKDLRRGNPRRAHDLREIAWVLNDDGYRALGRLVRRVCVLPVDAALIGAAWDAVTREPELRGRALPAFAVTPAAEPVFVRIYRGEIDDILVNLLRNAVQASLEAGTTRIDVRVDLDEDDITGLERVAVRVVDDAPRRISTAVIRGRYIERGLGLTVDLISRNGGSIHVEDEPGRSKAVVVRLPRAEVPEEDA